jgi:hypothetical protein
MSLKKCGSFIINRVYSVVIDGVSFLSVILQILLHLKTETDPISETSCLLLPKIPDDGESAKTQ